jgi:hypothetical protein
VSVTVRTSSGSAPVAWDPVALRRESLPEADGVIRLDLPALGSVFLVDGGPAEPPPGLPAAEVPIAGPWRLTLPGVLDTEIGEPLPWTELGPDATAFAGVGTYATEVELEAAPLGRTAVLDLGDVGDLARVRVNGTDCGVVWTAPWQVDVSAALRPGRNRIEIDVANAWMNRLIAEAARPTGTIFSPVARVYAPDAPVRASGLLSSVALQLFD